MSLGVSELASPHAVVTLSIDSPSQDFLKFCIDIQPDRYKTKKIVANFIPSNISQIKFIESIETCLIVRMKKILTLRFTNYSCIYCFIIKIRYIILEMCYESL